MCVCDDTQFRLCRHCGNLTDRVPTDVSDVLMRKQDTHLSLGEGERKQKAKRKHRERK